MTSLLEMREFIREHWRPGGDPSRYICIQDYVRDEYEKLDAAFAALPREQQEERISQIANRDRRDARAIARLFI
jgi:hypothetical protein